MVLLGLWADQQPHGWSQTMPQLLGQGTGASVGLPGGGGFSRCCTPKPTGQQREGNSCCFKTLPPLATGFP